ncbi:DJ-1/PfpI family protein [Streptomyces litchfieldiae]|uniref:DJ-1/PfpI family protein n=1 Tax=Streptomyces litchfieldiae TaxID=3075543 RepID=A0ABU2MQJ4_9ACTN|nr:DJ-1/PfpI family protein [Streptomyces sp. DSM 44938]MDT0343785.1 DJ-1/PfpI family protein [Streptomyces sp. DSM 44938]
MTHTTENADATEITDTADGTTRRRVLGASLATAALAGTGLATAGAARAERPAGAGPSVGILLYDGFSLLDPTGPAEVLSRLPDATVTMIGEARGPVRTDTGDTAVLAERAIAEVSRLDVLLVPGGGERGTTGAMANPALLSWIRAVHRHTAWTTSVCTGSLILAAAGLLEGRRATTHWASAEYLENELGVPYVPARYVPSGRIVTAAGVSAGVDMALYLAARIAGETVARGIQLAIEYDPTPPFDSGNAAEAGPELRALALRLIAESGT